MEQKLSLLQRLCSEMLEYNDCVERSLVEQYGNFEIIGPYVDANRKFKKRFESIVNRGEDLSIEMDI
jgi:hypothetical protein